MNDSNVHYWLQGTWGKRKVLYSLHVFTPWGSIKGLAISLSNASEVLDSEDGSRVLGEECKVRGEGFCEAWIVCTTVHYRYSGSGNRAPINPTQRNPFSPENHHPCARFTCSNHTHGEQVHKTIKWSSQCHLAVASDQSWPDQEG